jgi:hypothetical protein
MAKVPAEKHIHFSKLDLTDEYLLMSVQRREQRWNFASVMPANPDKELMVVVPSALHELGCPRLQYAPHWNPFFPTSIARPWTRPS